MPRPSIKQQRRSQILDAYEICLTRYGVEGTTLDLVAKEAGLARPLIRHNVGNRTELQAATVERFIERSSESTQQLLDALPKENPLETLIDWLFDPSASDPRMVLVSSALVAAGANDPALARSMREWTRDFVDKLINVAWLSHPDADDDAVRAVAVGIASAFFTAESVTPMGPMSDIRDACKQAAARLANTLKT